MLSPPFLSSNRMPISLVVGGGVDERLVELMPETLIVANIVKFCDLTNPIVGKVEIGSVIGDKGRKLEQSVRQGERHGSVATGVILGDGEGRP